MRVSKNDTICGLAAPAARQLMRAYFDDRPVEVARTDPAAVHPDVVPVLALPAARIDDGVVGLRAFGLRDLAAFEAAALPGGNDGTWLILNGDPGRSLAAHISGWTGAGGPAGPALAVVRTADDLLAGVVYFTVRSE